MSNQDVTREISSLVRQRLLNGEWPEGSRDRLNALVAKSAGISTDEASQRIDAAEQQIKDALAQAEQKAREAADAAARATAMAAFWAFAALLLGAATASIGACIGTRHATYYRETYVAR
jgi:demethoxyubiquinone hydroxylase (CLK1/Coq7/Cat5 family)